MVPFFRCSGGEVFGNWEGGLCIVAFVFGIGVICCGYMIPTEKENDF